MTAGAVSTGAGLAAEWPLSAGDGSSTGFTASSAASLQATNPSRLLVAVIHANYQS